METDVNKWPSTATEPFIAYPNTHWGWILNPGGELGRQANKHRGVSLGHVLGATEEKPTKPDKDRNMLPIIEAVMEDSSKVQQYVQPELVSLLSYP